MYKRAKDAIAAVYCLNKFKIIPSSEIIVELASDCNGDKYEDMKNIIECLLHDLTEENPQVIKLLLNYCLEKIF